MIAAILLLQAKHTRDSYTNALLALGRQWAGTTDQAGFLRAFWELSLAHGREIPAHGARAAEVDEDGEIWTYYPLCVKCGHKFAVPDSGLVCCVCLAGKKPSKIKDL